MTTPAFISALKSDRCIHYLNNNLINRAQNINIDANVPTELVEELGNVSTAGAVSSPAEVSFSVSAYDTGIDLCRTLTGNSTATSFNLGDFLNAQVDYVGVVRDNAGNFFRSVYVKNACINSMSFGYETKGSATEAYGFSGDNLTVFAGYVLTKTYTIQTADVTNGYFTLPTAGSEEPIQTNSGSYFSGAYLLRVTKTEGSVASNLEEGADYSYAAATKRVTASGLAAGQVWTIVFHSAAIGSALSPVFDNTTPAAIRGEFTPVSIGVSTKTWIPRLQSAKISVDLNQRRFPQLGNGQVVFAPGGIPAVSGEFSVLMNDLSLRKLLTYGTAGSAETQFGIEQMPQYGIQNNLGLEAAIKSPVDNAVIKRITVPEIIVTTGGMPANVNGILSESFTWTSRTSNLTIVNS